MNQHPPHSAHQMNHLPGPSNRSPIPQPVHPGAAQPQMTVNPQQIQPQQQPGVLQSELIRPWALPSVFPNGSKAIWAKIKTEAPVYVAGQGMVKRIVEIPFPVFQPKVPQEKNPPRQQPPMNQQQMAHGQQQQAMAPNAQTAHQMRPAQPAAPQPPHINHPTLADALRQVITPVPHVAQQPQQWQQMGANGGTLNMLNTNTLPNEGERTRKRKQQTPMRGGTLKRTNVDPLLNSLLSTTSPGSKENSTRTPTHIAV